MDYKIEISLEPYTGDLREQYNCFSYETGDLIQKALYALLMSMGKLNPDIKGE